MSETIRFTSVSEEDFATLYYWLRIPHVAEWWYPDVLPWDKYIEKYRRNLLSPHVHGYFIVIQEKPVGYIQAYDAAAIPDGEGNMDLPGSWGMDLYIADTDYLGRGFGPKVIVAFMNKLWSEHPIQKFIIDPHIENVRAIRTYERVGFKAVREGWQDYGKVVWMEKPVQGANAFPGPFD